MVDQKTGHRSDAGRSPLAPDLASLSVVPAAAEIFVVHHNNRVLPGSRATLGNRNAAVVCGDTHIVVASHLRIAPIQWGLYAAGRGVDQRSDLPCGESVLADRQRVDVRGAVDKVRIDKAERRSGAKT